MALKEIIDELYRPRPSRPLFHYTSLSGMTSIVEKRLLWTSEIRFVNDSAELGHFSRWLDLAVQRSNGVWPNEILTQFKSWYRDVFSSGSHLFIGCFTENGNLLSQWRGYCPEGGVSLGFDPELLQKAAATAHYRIGRCIYLEGAKLGAAQRVLAAVASYAQAHGQAPPSVAHPSQSFFPVFRKLEAELLAIAALVKSEAFSEEAEWRLVSLPHSDYAHTPMKFRIGANTLVPYMEFPLYETEGKLALKTLYVGPSPNMQMSMMAIPMFLSKHTSGYQVANCLIPYRTGK